MISRVILFFLSVNLLCSTAWAQEKFPFIATVSSETVNIRAGQSSNFEKLATLKKGDEVVVIEKNFSWYKVRLPVSARSFVSKKYIKVLDPNTGVVTGNRVNVRAGADSKFTSLGQLANETVVKITADKGEWIQIEPVDGLYGWISDEFLSFKSDKVPAVAPIVKFVPKPQAVEPPVLPAALPPPIEVPTGFSVSGRLQLVTISPPLKDISYKLIVNDQEIYYLQAPKSVIEDFLGYKVNVRGALKDDPQNIYAFPVVALTQIKLAL